MRQTCIGIAAVLVASITVIDAQQAPDTPAAPLTFEVASVKRDPKQGRGGPRPGAEISLPPVRVLPGGRVESYGHTLRNLIAVAYDVNMLYRKIEGKQEILETELVIEAKAADPSLTPADARAMVRTLLEERFQLRWRLQPRDVDGYLLVPAREDGRPGPGLRSFTDDCEARAQNASVPFESPEYEQKRRCGWTGINDRQRAVGVSMAAVAERLTSFMATTVSDRTGWPGLFTFDVVAGTDGLPYEAIMRSAAGLGARLQTDAPHLLEVFRRELGLKLVKERATVNDFIIEQVEPLIEN
jgi:uncharacterized protein (TIGR03435 family)